MRSDVVVPGKFEVLARAPHSALKSVVLPVFGLPISATRRTGTVAVDAARSGDSTAVGTAVMVPRSGR